MKTNDTLKNSLNQWQDYARAYTDFVFNSTEQALNTSLSLRERADKLVSDSLQQAQTLAGQEQAIALQAAETYLAQAQAAARRVARLFEVTPTP